MNIPKFNDLDCWSVGELLRISKLINNYRDVSVPLSDAESLWSIEDHLCAARENYEA